MATRIVEGKLPYTGGTGIGIDTNKVISLLLREENNLILVNNDNEVYTDLQLAVNITPTDEFPVGVTVGKVLAEDGWDQNGLLLNRKTTSGDYARWLYGADGELYFDGGQGTWKQVYYSDEVLNLFTQLRGELATVAFSGDYNDLINRPAFLQIQADWDQTDTDAPDYIKNKPTIPMVNDATLTIQKNGTGVATFTANSSTNVTANITVPNIINNVTSTSTTDGLSALQGKNLQDQIDDLKSMGRFLSLWDCTTGQPISFPLSTPYNYQTGDYYLVENTGTSNKRPSGVQYTGAASTTAETDEVEVGDMYIYDGTIWLLQINHGKSVSFANLSGQPSDNTNLAAALNAKADTSSISAVGFSGNYNDLTNKPTIPSGQIQSNWTQTNTSAVDYIKNKPTIPTKTSQLNNDSGFITSAYHDSSKQDVLVSGTSIKTINNTTLLGSGDISIEEYTASNGGVKIYDMPSVNSSMSDMITWLTSGGEIMLREQRAGSGLSTVEYYYFMSNRDGSGRSINVKNIAGSTVTAKTITYNAAGNCVDVLTQTTQLGDVKVFKMTSTTDNTDGPNAYNWYSAGGLPMYIYNGAAYSLYSVSTSSMVFQTTRYYSNYYLTYAYITLTISGGTVTASQESGPYTVYMMRADDTTTANYKTKVVTALPASPSSSTIYIVKGS